MRRAFEWLYRELDAGRSRHSVLCRAARHGFTRSTVRESFRHLDGLVRFDLEHCSDGLSVIGLDEVGRGPLAGPLVAVAVQLPYPTPPLLPFLRDSKMLGAAEREFLAGRILACAAQVGYGVVEATEFGREFNLHELTFIAMQRALEPFQGAGEKLYLLVDGRFSVPHWPFRQRAVVKGDDLSLSIAAASVLAKVHRDRIMRSLDQEFPDYGFAQHVGYGTASHRQALLLHGPCPQHRPNFLTGILTGSHPSEGEGACHDPNMSPMRGRESARGQVL